MNGHKQKRILIVCSHNGGNISPFVKEQAQSIENRNFEVEYFLIEGKGIWGYLKNFKSLKQKIKLFSPDIVHAHYGLSGLLAVLQRKVPVVVTFHGSDIHQRKNLKFSKIVMKLSAKHIFVSSKLKILANCSKGAVLPCGVDTSVFYPRDKKDCRNFLNFDQNKKYILFSSAFDNPIKNYTLADIALKKINNKNI